MVAIGINDACYINSEDNQWVPLPKFESNLEELVRQARNFTETIIFVGLTKVDESRSMPIAYAYGNYYYGNERGILYDAKIKEICEKNKLLFIPMRDLLSNEDLYDGLHPHSQGHEKMFLRVKDFLTENKIV
jgi:lysophospholipase L1-like esterase